MRHLHAATAAVALAASIGCSSEAGRPANFRPADIVLGQPDFTSASPDRGGAISAGGVRFPVGDAHFASDVLLLPDTHNHRLLGYRGLPRTIGVDADFVLGQPDAASGVPSHAAQGFHFPQTVWFDQGGLVVADTAASRVLMGAGTKTWAIGWSDVSAHRWGCAADRLSEPWSAITVAGKIIVADRSNHRVLVWNRVPMENGVPADLVLGQKDLDHCAANDPLGRGASGARSARTLRYPTDVWSDGVRLLVVDQGNNRVLLWNQFPSVNGAPADVVLGQGDFHVAVAETTQAGLSGPGFVASDGRGIFVADVRNHRILGWRSFPSADGAPADLVLGQGDFQHGAANDDDQDGVTDGPTARTLNHPMGVAIAGDFLIVADTYNHRYLLYRSR